MNTVKNPHITIFENQIELSLGHSYGISSDKQDDLISVRYELMKLRFKQVLFLESDISVLPTMTVLEYLVYMTKIQRVNHYYATELQLLNLLEAANLGYISLTAMQYLTKEEKMIVGLIVALFSNKEIIVFQICDYNFSMSLLHSIQYLIRTLLKQTSVLLVITMQPNLIGICLTNVIFVQDKKINYYGSVTLLRDTMDRVLYAIEHHDMDMMYHNLLEAFPLYEIRRTPSKIYVMRTTTERDDSFFLHTLSKQGIMPDHLKFNHGKVKHSFQELIELHENFK